METLSVLKSFVEVIQKAIIMTSLYHPVSIPMETPKAQMTSLYHPVFIPMETPKAQMTSFYHPVSIPMETPKAQMTCSYRPVSIPMDTPIPTQMESPMRVPAGCLPLQQPAVNILTRTENLLK